MCLRVNLEFYQVKYSALGCKEANATSFIIIKKNQLCVRSGFVGPGGLQPRVQTNKTKPAKGNKMLGLTFMVGQ